jgi:selenium metabolism protein YedF
MEVRVDARGLECPKPVVQTKKAFDGIGDGTVVAVVDNEIAKENVIKFAKSVNCLYDVKEIGSDFQITIFKADGGGADMSALVMDDYMCEPKLPIQDIAILVGKDKFGEGSDELGEVLIKGYFYTLTETTPLPKAIMFVNSGVYLTTEGSSVLEHIKMLESNGVEIISCGTCLDYYNVKDKLAVGGVGNMYSIVEKMNGAKNTIRI